jgi:tetratricopeptide (TPR) repeat protein
MEPRFGSGSGEARPVSRAVRELRTIVARGDFRDALIAFQQGRLEQADGAFSNVLQLARLANDHLAMARAWNNLGIIADSRGDISGAIRAHRKTIASFAFLGDDRGLAEAYHNLAIALRESGRLAEATEAVAFAIQYATRVGEGSLIALATMGAAELALKTEDWLGAESLLDDAHARAAAADDVLGQGEIVRLRAELALRRREWEQADRQAAWAAAIGAKQGCLQLRAEAVAVRATALKQGGRTPEAEACRAEAETAFRALEAGYLSIQFRDGWAAA